MDLIRNLSLFVIATLSAAGADGSGRRSAGPGAAHLVDTVTPPVVAVPGKPIRHDYTPEGFLSAVHHPEDVVGGQEQVRWDYEVDTGAGRIGLVRAVTRAANVPALAERTEFTYDRMGRLEELRPPAMASDAVAPLYFPP